MKDYIERFHKLAASEKGNFLKFIFEFGEKRVFRHDKNIKMLFKFPLGKISLWWFSRIAEKPTVKSDFYSNLISFLISEKVETKQRNLKGYLKETPYYYFFDGVRYLFYLIIRSFYARLFIKKYSERGKQLSTMDYIVVSYFPLIDEKKAKEVVFENRYIPSFHRALERRKKGRYAHICLPVSIDGHDYKSSINLINKFLENQSLFLVEEFFKPVHSILLLVYYFYFFTLFILNKSKIRKEMVYKYESRGYDVWPIFKNDFYHSFCGARSIASLYYILVFKEIISHVKKECKILCICEMQWWEKALYFYAKEKGIMTIGYQHTTLSELWLDYFNDAREIIEEKGVETCPLPDYIATVGETTRKHLTNWGWPEDRVFVWGGLRFDALKGYRQINSNWQEKENYIVCTFSMSYSESTNLLFFLMQAFKENTGYKILLKSHPVLPIKNLTKTLNIEVNSAIFEFTDTPLDKIMSSAKGMIVTESSSPLYAIANGCPVIIPRFRNMLDLNPLSYVSDIPLYVYSPQELRETCDKIITTQNSPIPVEKCHKFLDNYLYFPDFEEGYLEKIDNLNP